MNYHEIFGKMMDSVKPDWDQPTTARVVSICAKVTSELLNNPTVNIDDPIRDIEGYAESVAQKLSRGKVRKTPEGGGEAKQKTR